MNLPSKRRRRTAAAVVAATGLVLAACVSDTTPVVVGEPTADADRGSTTPDPVPTGSATSPDPGDATGGPSDPAASTTDEPTDGPTDEPSVLPTTTEAATTSTTTSPATTSPTSAPPSTTSPTTPPPTPTTPPPTTSSPSEATTTAPANRAPTAVSDSARTTEGDNVRIRPLDNDSDPDGDTLTIVSITQPEGGSATEFSNNITYMPDPGFSGWDSLTYRVSDGNGGTDTGVIQIFVEDNGPPVATDDTASTEEGVATTIRVLANDDDPEGDALTVASYTQPSGGSVARSGDDLRFTPDMDFVGSTSFTYTVEDTLGQSDTATVRVTVTAGNAAPTANNDSATVIRGESVMLALTRNDSDPDGDPLTIEIVTNPSQGSVTLVDDTTVQYTHDARATGATDSFTYRVVDPDGARSNTATVSISVNQRPVAVYDTVSTINGQSQSFNVITGSGTNSNPDYDPDNDTISIDAINQALAGGTLTCSSNGACSWSHSGSYTFGTFYVNYTLRDARGATTTGTLEFRSQYLG